MVIAEKYKQASKELIKVIPKKERYFFYLGAFILLTITLSAVILVLVFLEVPKFLNHQV